MYSNSKNVFIYQFIHLKKIWGAWLISLILLRAENNFLVHLCCYNKISETEKLIKNINLFFHSSRGWEVQDHAMGRFGVPSSKWEKCCVLTWLKAEKGESKIAECCRKPLSVLGPLSTLGEEESTLPNNLSKTTPPNAINWQHLNSGADAFKSWQRDK